MFALHHCMGEFIIAFYPYICYQIVSHKEEAAWYSFHVAFMMVVMCTLQRHIAFPLVVIQCDQILQMSLGPSSPFSKVP